MDFFFKIIQNKFVQYCTSMYICKTKHNNMQNSVEKVQKVQRLVKAFYAINETNSDLLDCNDIAAAIFAIAELNGVELNPSTDEYFTDAISLPLTLGQFRDLCYDVFDFSNIK